MTIAIAALGACALALALAGGALAAESPRWAIVSSVSPTNVRPESPRNEVQEVSVDATSGTFTLSIRTSACGSLGTTAALAYDATAAEVQAALLAIKCDFPAGSVAVSGGPGGSTPYTLSFQGSLAGHGQELLTADSSALSGGKGVSVKEVTQGTETAEMVITAINVGGASTNGETITVEDTLPAGFSAVSAIGFDPYRSGIGLNIFGSVPMTCSLSTPLKCTYSKAVSPGGVLVMIVKLKVAGGLPESVTNEASVSGGGAEGASHSTPITVSDTPASFGVTRGSVLSELSTTQAGAHPNFTTSFSLNTRIADNVSALPKDVRFDLPPGLVGDAVGMPQCRINAVVTQAKNPNACPADTMVGMATVTLNIGNGQSTLTFLTAVYNIAPSPGEPVALAFDALVFPVRLDTSVLSNGDYGVRVTSSGLSQAAQTLGATITIWGVPADHSGPGEFKTDFQTTFGEPNPSQTRVAFLTNPQQCSQPLTTAMAADSWPNPGVFKGEEVSTGTLTGCDTVPFSSSFTMLPDTLEAGAPAGYTFNLNVPQSNSPEVLATANVKDVKVTLPAGTVVNPSAAWGLRACSDAQFGLHSGVPGQCPREAQVGTVEIHTPDLPLPLQGDVYLGEPECDPCTPADAEDGRMVRLLVQVVGEGESGIIVKFEGHGHINQSNGQITTIFEDNPQLPFNGLKLTLGGGPRAVLANSRTCGPARTDMDLTPWSSPFAVDSNPFYEFEINQGCFGPRFAPAFKAGMPNIQAGAHGEFTLAFGREDHDELLNGVSVKMPPGLLGSLTGIPLCREAEANMGTCSSASELGTVEALTGPGASPFLVSGGHVYLTEGYGGSQFGLSIVVPAVAGPYTLAGTTGRGTVVVRSQIFIDPRTAQLTVTSGSLPSMLDGIPLQLKAVNVRINRPSFMFNPTSCEKMAITGTLTAVEGMSANVASPFQVTNCAALAFKPGFTARTKAKHPRKDGAYLQVNVTSGEGQANIAKAKVELPRALPSRLSTLQQACTEAQLSGDGKLYHVPPTHVNRGVGAARRRCLAGVHLGGETRTPLRH